MAAQIIELFKSGEGTEGLDEASAVKIYAVTGEHDEAAVRTLVEATIPNLYLGLTISDYNVRPLGGGFWDVTASYGTKKLTQLGEVVTSFDTTGGTRHVKQSLSTTAYAPAGQTAPNTYGVIGYNGDKIDGVDIPQAAQFTFQKTKSWPFSAMTAAKIVAIADMTLRVNTDVFFDFAPGTLIFLGATGSQRGYKDWEVTYQFGFSPNVTNLTVGTITGISKKGWEYLWCLYADDESETWLIKRPIAAYVEQVCRTAAFSALGI